MASIGSRVSGTRMPISMLIVKGIISLMAGITMSFWGRDRKATKVWKQP